MAIARPSLRSLHLVPPLTRAPLIAASRLASLSLQPILSSSPRPFSTSSIAKMPSMPQGIVKGGKEQIQLADAKLFQMQGFIDGKWVGAKDGATLKVHNKATQAELGTIPDMGLDDVKAAIAAADAAFPAWSKTTPKERSEKLAKLYALLQANADDLAKIIVAENGKTLAEAKGEVAYSNSFIDWFAAEAQRMYGYSIPASVPGLRNVIVQQPIGVCALITPWNFPAAMITRKIGPALAAGCTSVIKAPAETPYSALAIAYLAEQVGFPKGVINVVTTSKGDKEAAIGKELCENPVIRKLSFTGSTRVGKILMQQSASNLTKLSMELGGNAPFIVFEDADLDKAVDGAIACKFRGSGQTCICANRIYVHDSIYDEFAKRLAAKVDKFKVGYGLDEGVTHGPLVNEAGKNKVKEHVDKCVAAGAKVLVGGKPGEGLFFEPTLLVDLPESCPMDDEETFGPLGALYRFKTEEEVVKKANNTDVGLASYIFSKDVNRCWRVGEALQTGMTGVNTGIISQAVIPFGGVKHSGFGREGAFGIKEYTTEKVLVFGEA